MTLVRPVRFEAPASPKSAVTCSVKTCPQLAVLVRINKDGKEAKYLLNLNN